jgi:hypothetical protein
LLREYEMIAAFSSASVEADAVRPTGPATALPSPPISNLSFSRPAIASSFMNNKTKSVFDAPICKPTLPPPKSKNAGALQPPLTRRLITP